jgi:hypothetical protein
MFDLNFEIQAEWNGAGKSGEGQLIIREKKIQYSAPSNMGGKGDLWQGGCCRRRCRLQDPAHCKNAAR